MRVIARATLYRFLRNRVDPRVRKAVKLHLDAWYAEAASAQWKNSGELKLQYRSASIISSERVVFNIRGNDYRLIAAINYQHRILFIIWLGTHKEYDRIDVERIEYDERRYADSPNPDSEGS